MQLPWRTVWSFLRKLKIELTWSSNLTPGHIPWVFKLYLNLKKIDVYIYMWLVMTTWHSHKTWKPPKCTLTGEWIKWIWYRYTVKYCLAIQKEQNWIICRPMGGPVKWSEVNQNEKNKYYILMHIYGIWKHVISLHKSIWGKQPHVSEYQQQTMKRSTLEKDQGSEWYVCSSKIIFTHYCLLKFFLSIQDNFGN
jgi:hypothetical protein